MINLIKEAFDKYDATSKDEVYVVVNVQNILKSAGVFKEEYIKKALELSVGREFKTSNDYYYLAMQSVIGSKKLKKVAYPMNFEQFKPIKEANLEVWSELVYKIYSDVTNGKKSYPDALDFYAKDLDIDERERFKKWVEYYKDGNSKKYSSKENSMEKKGFQFSLGPTGLYSGDRNIKPENEDHIKKIKEKMEKKEFYNEWKGKLYSTIRRLDKLIRSGEDFIDTDAHTDLADLLHSFDIEVRKLKLASTTSDLAFKTANQFKKLGFQDGYDELIKFAQQQPEQVDTTPEEVVPDPIGLEDPVEPVGASDAPTKAPPPTDPGGGPDAATSQPPKGSEGAIAGAFENSETQSDYSLLAGDVSLEIAGDKLEEIASRLSDRRTIRQLAEFDIILDKLGIAQMFPELAEAQSKLIDAYSYALVRVTKMLGMIASGKDLSELAAAKTDSLVNKTMKDVDKVLSPEEEVGDRGAEQLNKEVDQIQPEAPAEPAAQPEQPQPQA